MWVLLIYQSKQICKVNTVLTLKESKENQMSEFMSAKFKKCFIQTISYQKRFFQPFSYQESKDYLANNVDLDEVAHYEPPYLDLHCVQILLLFFIAYSVNTSEEFFQWSVPTQPV